jgi:hypothetical protein
MRNLLPSHKNGLFNKITPEPLLYLSLVFVHIFLKYKVRSQYLKKQKLARRVFARALLLFRQKSIFYAHFTLVITESNISASKPIGTGGRLAPVSVWKTAFPIIFYILPYYIMNKQLLA